MLGSLRYRSQACSFDEEYPDMNDVIEDCHVDLDHYQNELMESPTHYNHVYIGDSPPYQSIDENAEQCFDTEKCSHSVPSKDMGDNEHIIVFNRAWHRAKEPKLSVSPMLFHYNPELTASMRCRLVNWMIEVCLHFRLHRETLYLAVYYMDRYLTVRSHVSKRSLQLLGISSLFVAAKLEEIYAPKIVEFEDVCDGSCPAALIHETEVNILMALRWHLNVATPLYWLGCYTNLICLETPQYEYEVRRVSEMALKIIDMALHTPIATRFPYSVIAASALYLFLKDWDMVSWAASLQWEEVCDCVAVLRPLWNLKMITYPSPAVKCKPREYDQIVEHNTTVLQNILGELKRGNFV